MYSPDHDSQTSGNDNNTDRRRRHRRLRRGPSDRYGQERERVLSGSSPHELIWMLVAEEHEGKQARKLVQTALRRLDAETQRADAAEARAEGATRRFGALMEELVAVREEAKRTKEELEVYKVQMEMAQREIERAQEVLGVLERERDEAEVEAARARTTARRINEEHMVLQAREEGRRLGFEEGLRRGREVGFDEGHELGYQHDRESLLTRRSRTDDGDSAFVDVVVVPTPVRAEDRNISPLLPRATLDSNSFMAGPEVGTSTGTVVGDGQQPIASSYASGSTPRPLQRRRSSPETVSSVTTSLSQLDLVSFPNPVSRGRSGSGTVVDGVGRDRAAGPTLSVIREDTASGSGRSSVRSGGGGAIPSAAASRESLALSGGRSGQGSVSATTETPVGSAGRSKGKNKMNPMDEGFTFEIVPPPQSSSDEMGRQQTGYDEVPLGFQGGPSRSASEPEDFTGIGSGGGMRMRATASGGGSPVMERGWNGNGEKERELRRVPSSGSVGSTSSYSRFDRRTYLDPAYWPN